MPRASEQRRDCPRASDGGMSRSSARGLSPWQHFHNHGATGSFLEFMGNPTSGISSHFLSQTTSQSFPELQPWYGLIGYLDQSPYDMSRLTRETEIYRRDAKSKHNLLTPEEREKLLKPYLPELSSKSQGNDIPSESIGIFKTRSRLGIRRFLRNQLHLLVFIIIQTFFSIYVRLRQGYHAVHDRIFTIMYYHHRTPELIRKDVKGLRRLPEHLSVILKLEDGVKGGAELAALVDEVAEIAAWCACIGIPLLSIYERTGILKGYIPATHRAITRKFSSYFGPNLPALSLRAPHTPSMESAPTTPITGSPTEQYHLSMLLLSVDDGRDSLVDLTKTLTEMSQRSKLSPKDISIDLVDAEISESIMVEPDLLLLFSPSVELSGYPPWQIRLTEIYHVQDNHGVGYQVFLRALYSYANAQMRFGR